MRRSYLFIASLAAVAMLVSVVACGSPAPTATKAPVPTAAPTTVQILATATPVPTSTSAPVATPTTPPSILKVGVVAAMTGPGASWGLPIINTHQLVADRINAAGGVTVQGKKYLFQIVPGDDKYDAATAVTVAQKLIFDDKVSFFSGTLAAASVKAMAPITDANKILHFPDSWADKDAFANTKYVFRTTMNIPSLHRDPGNWQAYKQKWPDYKTVAGITTNDDSGYAGLQSVFDSADAAGFTIVGAQMYQRGTTDFKSYLTPLLAKSPDMLSLGSDPEGDIAIIIKQARDLGFKGRFVGPNVDAVSLGKLVSKDLMEGMLSYAVGTSGPGTPPAALQAMQAYNAKYGEMNPIAAEMWDNLYLLKMVIEKANSLDPDKLAATMDTLGEFDTVFGKAHMGGAQYYGRNLQIIGPQPVSEIQNGENVNILSAMPTENPLPHKKWW